MRRLLPAHAVLGGAVAGFAAAVAVSRPAFGPAFLGVAVGALAIFWSASGLPLRLAALALAGFAVACWWGGVRLATLDRSVMLAEIGRAGDALVVTTGDPRAGRFAQRQSARLESFEGTPVGEPVELELPLGRSPPRGASLSVLAVVKRPRGPSHGYDERAWLRRQGIHVVLRVDRWRVVGRRGGLGGAADEVRAWLRRSSAPGLRGERRAVVEGVLLGDDAALSPELAQAFRRSGLYHLLAVSGQNVVLLAGGVLAVGVAVGAPRRLGHLAALAAIGGYVVAVGPQASVIRAAIAGGAVSVAWLAGRERDRWHVFLLAASVLLAWNPLELEDPGFQLSFGAVLGIFVAVGPALRILQGYPVPAGLSGALAISAVCSVVTAPILWLQFRAVPLLGVVANALVEPAVGPLLGLAFVAAAVDPVSPGLARAVAWVNGLLALYVATCARVVAAVPFAQAKGRWAALAAAGSLGVVALVVRRLRLARTPTG